MIGSGWGRGSIGEGGGEFPSSCWFVGIGLPPEMQSCVEVDGRCNDPHGDSTESDVVPL